jgi:hypothetical protein
MMNRQFACLAGVAGDLLAGEVFERDGQGLADGVDGGCESEQQAGIFGGGEESDDRFTGALGLALGSLAQAFAVLVVGKCLNERGQSFFEENIPVV